MRRQRTPFFEITTHEVPMSGLPAALDGARIVQLSDLHQGNGRNADLILGAAVARANALEPDYLFLTGDFVDHHPEDVLPAVRIVSGLCARKGVYAVLGNHDYRGDPRLLKRALTDAGIHVLDNTAVELTPGFWLAGVDDLLEGEGDLEKTLAAFPADAPAILLSHIPDALNRVPLDRRLWILSGHTHGGQFALPGTSALICRFFLKTRFVHGWYTRGRARMYVHRGVGVTGPGPLATRLFCPREIAQFVLRATPSPDAGR